VFPGSEGEGMGRGLLCPCGLLMGWIRAACDPGLQTEWGMYVHPEAEKIRLPRWLYITRGLLQPTESTSDGITPYYVSTHYEQFTRYTTHSGDKSETFPSTILPKFNTPSANYTAK